MRKVINEESHLQITSFGFITPTGIIENKVSIDFVIPKYEVEATEKDGMVYYNTTFEGINFKIGKINDK